MALSYGSFEIVAVRDGVLDLPLRRRRALVLRPGDMLSMQLGDLALHLELYREFLDDDWSVIDPETRWHYLRDFLSRPLTAVDGRGRLVIPPEVLLVKRGDLFDLQIFQQGGVHLLFLTRRNLALQIEGVRLPAREAAVPAGA